MNNININKYSGLELDTKINFYKNKESFQYDINNLEDFELFQNIFVKEFEITKYSKNEDIYINFFEIILNNINNQNIIALITDFKIKEISRLRSYKGILNKNLKLNSELLIENEIIIQNNNSIIGNLLLINNQNINEIISNYFYNSDNCCFLLLNKSEINNKLLVDILQNHMSHKNTSIINYFSLCKLLKTKEDKIFRIGGNGSNLLSLQIFSLIK